MLHFGVYVYNILEMAAKFECFPILKTRVIKAQWSHIDDLWVYDYVFGVQEVNVQYCSASKMCIYTISKIAAIVRVLRHINQFHNFATN